jgi:Beta-lactamase enzyme family
VAHVAQYFPLVVLGETIWDESRLWYHVAWNVSGRTTSGWVAADVVTFTSSGNEAPTASMDTLSPQLAAYLAALGGNVGAVVYDVTHQEYYTYNPSASFITGSSMKVAIMLTFFSMIEHQGREPTDGEVDLLATMIENSNNDSASALYYGEIGGAAGVSNYLQSIAVGGLSPNPTAWGGSGITPMTMVNLLTLLYEGKILTPHHRDLAFCWMEHIEPDQRVGVGDTAPQGATVAMKDGWLPDSDGLWAFNSSGIVTRGQQTYIISVYTQQQPALVSGQAIARNFCSAVASLLLRDSSRAG